MRILFLCNQWHLQKQLVSWLDCPELAAAGHEFIPCVADERILDHWQPQAIVIWGGTFYAERIAALLARRRGLRVIAVENTAFRDRIYVDAAGVTGNRHAAAHCRHWLEGRAFYSGKGLTHDVCSCAAYPAVMARPLVMDGCNLLAPEDTARAGDRVSQRWASRGRAPAGGTRRRGKACLAPTSRSARAELPRRGRPGRGG
ncbi:MAG TPA: hypothetical protein VM221_05385 [Armatimonadota bacterium]|nr:hypothetical protein [Armatimonadota bacterium]